MKNKNSHNFGIEGEKKAKQYFLDKGYQILHENWRFKKYEVDLIVSYKDIIVFVEVKSRSSNAFGEPEQFVTKQKQNFLIAAANAYLQVFDINLECRFDIISILQLNNTFVLKHLEAAFYPAIK